MIEFYRAGTTMTITEERLAVIAAGRLPIAALSPIYGMHLIAQDHDHLPRLLLVLTVMAIMSTSLTRDERRGRR